MTHTILKLHQKQLVKCPCSEGRAISPIDQLGDISKHGFKAASAKVAGLGIILLRTYPPGC